MTQDDKIETGQSILYLCRMMFKTFGFFLVLLYTMIFLALQVNMANAASLKSEALINDSVIRASDLFDDIPAQKDAVIGNAPAVGQTIVLNARALSRIADLYDLKWEASTPADQITIRRTEHTIGLDDITKLLRRSLEDRGVTGNFNVSLHNVVPTITLPGDVPATAEISQMNYVAGRDVFSAVISAPSAERPVKTLMVSGLIEKTMQIPVLNSPMKAGDIIGSTDIEWIDIAQKNMVRDTVVDADDLIGKTPSRPMMAGSPIRLRDVVAPQMIARGDEILLEFNEGGLLLTAKGKAMQNGAEGDVIRVMNVSSNQSLRAEVTGHKMVRVQ